MSLLDAVEQSSSAKLGRQFVDMAVIALFGFIVICWATETTGFGGPHSGNSLNESNGIAGIQLVDVFVLI